MVHGLFIVISIIGPQDWCQSSLLIGSCKGWLSLLLIVARINVPNLD
ncbi:hypothetical protein SLEP1_g2537 [Rubroshorea leprosula]|uniref:Uncharacterized protein n=1 Tax=Rubroshorea leprosula TaxID=152421 RepID=A0AAV5HHH3_9ROSI|nr:hypothetical protein SLEP1_g2537 [Rubroshorea leprosula]